GIVEEVGTLVSRTARGPGARLVVECGFPELQLGESICVGGVCLTVDRIGRGSFEADASAETLQRSTLAHARAGAPVNLERALLPTSRLGGHYVAGHADGVAKLLSKRELGEAWQLRVGLPAELARYVAPKGSIAIDGVSLTANEVGDEWFEVVVIPHTMRATTLDRLRVGDFVTLEVDVLARYVARQLSFGVEGREATSLEEHPIYRKLRDGGYL
ncbi:MAG: riboflavin synthase, partial [Polyangiales bacterium]